MYEEINHDRTIKNYTTGLDISLDQSIYTEKEKKKIYDISHRPIGVLVLSIFNTRGLWCAYVLISPATWCLCGDCKELAQLTSFLG